MYTLLDDVKEKQKENLHSVTMAERLKRQTHCKREGELEDCKRQKCDDISSSIKVCYLATTTDILKETIVSFLPPVDKCSFFLAIEGSVCDTFRNKRSKRLWASHQTVTVNPYTQWQSMTESQRSLYGDYGRCLERLNIHRTNCDNCMWMCGTMVRFFDDVADGQQLRVLTLTGFVCSGSFYCVICNLLRKSIRLRVIDMNAGHHKPWVDMVPDVFAVLLEPETCPELQELRGIEAYRTYRFFSQGNPELKALSKFTKLREMQVPHEYMTEGPVQFLASVDSPPLQLLTVVRVQSCKEGWFDWILSVPLSGFDRLEEAKPSLDVDV